MTQEYTSKDTSLNQVPALHRWYARKVGPTSDRQATVVDLGAGKYDAAGNHLRDQIPGITYYPYDPYNRDMWTNSTALAALILDPCDVLCANVLNVIKEPEHRDEVMYRASLCAGKAYFTVHEGDGTGEGRRTTKGWQNNRKTASYIDELEVWFDHVERKGSVLVCWNDSTSVNVAEVA